ncbi:MATE family efflux transporter [Viridibacillus sp. YIM B01967]|uniref:Multidrug export protein MepA n=1 Tax=Viridibacillus soli TaxID=2798301 RepID=A0ABS1H3M8_9BACL|nr:MATE family efflux transporter [Viridibacillus soli]MBK3493668.1 MATE family efflux transporter [Viridibacillus soli]
MSESTFNLQNRPVPKVFASYLVPSLLGMLLMAINILVDGIFVSNGIGPEALAGVNIAVPIFSILLSISLWIGMGGATLYSISLGQGDTKKARSIFTQSFVLAVSIVGILVALSLWKQEEIAYLFGASDVIFPYVKDYLHIILLFGIVYVLENILSIFIRNDGNPTLAMIGLVTTSILNIVFNYIFIFMMNMGVEGAAYATAFSTIIGLFVLLYHFVRKESVLRFVKFSPDRKIVSEILKIGSPSFVVEGSAAIIVVAYNITFSHFVGEIGVTAYAVVNYLHVVFLMIFIGIGAALQPIVSFHFGAKLFDRLQAFLKLGLITGVGFGVVILLMGWFLADPMIALFGVTDPEVTAFTKEGISYFFIGYLFLSFNLIMAEYYQSIKRIRLSMIIIILRSLVLFLPLLWILPTYFGPEYIWLAFTLAEGVTGIGLFIGKKVFRNISPERNLNENSAHSVIS